MGIHKIYLPTLKSITISNFTLYSGIPEVEVDFDKPVICLAGANGLGKSTFLNIIMYALTGIVRDPDYQFIGIKDLRKKGVNYSGDYFQGRVSNTDSESSQVKLRFVINNAEITVCRNFINEGEFLYWNESSKGTQVNYSEREYENYITELMRLDSFEQFIFLVHYIFMFDESRQTLFWNSNLITASLNLLVGLDPKEATIADELSRKIDQLDSQVRNISWDISKAKGYIENLNKDLVGDKGNETYYDEEYRNRHKQLTTELDEIKSDINKANNKMVSVRSLIVNTSANIFKVKQAYDHEYKMLFSDSKNRNRVMNHPIIHELIDTGNCSICGGKNISNEYVLKQIEDCRCPVCGCDIENIDNNTGVDKLKAMDEELFELNRKYEEYQLEFNKIEELLNNLTKLYEGKRLELIEFENKISSILEYTNKENSVRELIKHQLEMINILANRKDELTKQREEAKREAQKIRSRVANKFLEIQENFIPIFKSLAFKFTGLPVNIQLKEITRNHRAEISFCLEIDDDDRLFKHQLSESQRFFIDIALRMSFIIYLGNVSGTKGGVLFLDTPEGSLDIAYETNAGEMLADFSTWGKQLILTANINSSGLLIELAKCCGANNFKLIRMINWAKLSTVHQERLALIEDVFNNLDNILEGKNEY